MKLRIIAVGSNQLIAEEMRAAVRTILGSDISVECLLIQEIQADCCPGDLFVCGITQFSSLAKVISAEKILVLNLAPTSQFFVQVARIAPGETIHVFNNKLEYTRVLTEACHQVGLTEFNFIPIAYEEMPEDEVRAKLQQANYIVGVDNQVGSQVLLSQFASSLKSDVQIIGAKRVASIQTASALIQRLAILLQKEISERAMKITNQLLTTVEAPVTKEYEHGFLIVAEELDKLAKETIGSAEAIRKAAIQSVTSQITPEFTIKEVKPA